MKATVQPLGVDILCRSEAAPNEFRLDANDLLDTLADWSQRYEAAVQCGMDGELLAIGREMFARLDGNGWASAWAQASGARALEIRVEAFDDALPRALLDAPWELLANRHGHLADDRLQLFEVVRRIGAAGEALAPRHSDLRVMFMAAAPAGESVLDFESEEAAILAATRHLPLHLVVEESGAARFLGERLRLDGPFEALHLSCHGTIDRRDGPQLALENEIGELALADAGEIAALLGEPGDTPLVFLSACQTAEESCGKGSHARGFEPFVRALTRAGVANVLGWDGSVYDEDAQAFAETFYRELAGYQRVARAAAVARMELRQRRIADPQRGRHWHLARLYLGPGGGGALAARGLAKRTPAGAAYEEQFLDRERHEVPVATRAQFVGRRREAQAVLKAFRDGRPGVLIHGMANLGKSSLAARVASRLPTHKTVVVFKRYDALSVFDRVIEAVPARQRSSLRADWREALLADAGHFSDALEHLLTGPLAAQPILLIVDDLESILDTPQPADSATPVAAGYRAALGAILKAFARARSESQLLLTSRYRFRLPDERGRDLAAGLVVVPLRPMDSGERAKQLRAAQRGSGKPAPDDELLERALAVAGGNPGLQEVLTTPMILAGETITAESALAAIEHYQQTGVPPDAIRRLLESRVGADESNAIVAFFKRMAFERYRAALTGAQAKLLRAACVFKSGMAVPRTAIETAGSALGVADSKQALDRLLGLGLVDDWGGIGGIAHAAANPLARPLSEALDEATTSLLAESVLPVLAAVWREADGSFAQDWRAVEITRLALAAPAPDPELLAAVAEAAGLYIFYRENDARRALDSVLQPALARLDALGAAPGCRLLLIAVDCAERLGETEIHDGALALLVRFAVDGDDDFERGGALLSFARRHRKQGEIKYAEEAFGLAASVFRDAGYEREWAIARGGVADILQVRGELDEALRIRIEEELSVHQRFGDVREKAVTQGKIADILEARGALDEALALNEERLPIAERLGDIDSIAHIKWSMALLRLKRGEYEIGGMQRIHDELAEAFAISIKLGRADFIGGIGYLLAHILAMAGQRERALEVLGDAAAAFSKLGNAEGIASVRELREAISAARGSPPAAEPP